MSELWRKDGKLVMGEWTGIVKNMNVLINYFAFAVIGDLSVRNAVMKAYTIRLQQRKQK